MPDTNAANDEEDRSALEEPEFQETQGTYYGQHRRMVYLLGSIVCLALGAAVGYLVLPDDWSTFRKLAGGGFMGLWCGYCVFAWRFLFYGTVD
jgi:hypothetical protein